MKQLVLELGIPAPPPAIWETLTPEQRAVVVDVLARLMAKTLLDHEVPVEATPDE